MTSPTSSAPERVLHIVGRMDRAGAETMLMNYYRALDRTVLQFDFLAYTQDVCDYDAEIEALGGRVVRMDGNSGWVARTLSMARTLRKGRWRAVHAHTNFSNMFAMFAAWIARIPIRISHAHVTDIAAQSPSKRLYQAVAPWLIGVFSTHRVSCGQSASALLYRPDVEVTVLPNAVRTDDFVLDRGEASRRVRGELGIGPNTRIILQIARLDPVKNTLFLVDLAKRLRERNEDFVVLIAGRGDMEALVRSAIEENDLHGHVKLLGVRDDIPVLLNGADAFVLPSFSEGFPVALVEAQAAGTPCYVSDRISMEVDLGMGLVSFHAVPDEPGADDAFCFTDDWASALAQGELRTFPSAQQRRAVLQSTGFCTSSAVARLGQLYGVNFSPSSSTRNKS